MNMSEYDALAQGIHAKAEEAKAAASRTAVYKETLSKSVAQYEKKYGVKLGDPENLDLAALKSALLQEKSSLGDEVKKLADRFNEIKNKDYAAEEERNLQASKTQEGIQGGSADSADSEDEMALDDPVENAQDAEDAESAQSTQAAAPKTSFQGIASAVAQQEANADYPEYEDYSEEDYGEEEPSEPEEVGEPEGAEEPSGSKEASFADIIRDQAVVTSSPYDSQDAHEAASSAGSTDDIDLSSLL